MANKYNDLYRFCKDHDCLGISFQIDAMTEEFYKMKEIAVWYANKEMPAIKSEDDLEHPVVKYAQMITDSYRELEDKLKEYILEYANDREERLSKLEVVKAEDLDNCLNGL